jgi:predicted lactoylglutathione lyase
MEQRVSLITLGVADLGRARAFYERMGWKGQETEGTVFFQLGCMVVCLWGRDQLAADAGIEDTGGNAGIAIAQNVRSEAEVDEVLRRALDAGATVTRPAAPTFYGGYAGYFRDLDGHSWEIAYNPSFPLDEDGAITIPDFGATT